MTSFLRKKDYSGGRIFLAEEENVNPGVCVGGGGGARLRDEQFCSTR